MLTPEKEKEIRDRANDKHLFHGNEVNQLLAEIDGLREENKLLQMRDVLADLYVKLTKDCDQLREKLAVAVGEINTLAEKVDDKLRSIMVGNYTHLVNSYRSQIGTIFKEALSKIGGEK
jgi:hypothetical protein